jgi:hypothetical protein
MEPKNSPSELAASIKANTREASTFWYWRDKPVGEQGAANGILRAGGVDVVDLVSRHEDPPDCEATLDGYWSGVEVTELVDLPTLERNIRATKERNAGKEPEQSEAYFIWDRDSLVSALRAGIDRKDRPWKGGPYQRRVLVMCTNEFLLDRANVDRFLQGAAFRTKLITDVFLGLSYHDGCIPVFHFAASQQVIDGTRTLERRPSSFVPRYDVFPFAGTMAEEFPSRESMIQLVLKRASTSRPFGEWNDDNLDVLADGVVVGRIFKANPAPVASPWMWTLAFGHHEDRSPTHGYAETPEAAMAGLRAALIRRP